MKPLTYGDLLKMHVDMFGVEPVFYGQTTEPCMNLVAAAIERGEPHIEEPVPDGVLT